MTEVHSLLGLFGAFALVTIGAFLVGLSSGYLVLRAERRDKHIPPG